MIGCSQIIETNDTNANANTSMDTDTNTSMDTDTSMHTNSHSHTDTNTDTDSNSNSNSINETEFCWDNTDSYSTCFVIDAMLRKERTTYAQHDSYGFVRSSAAAPTVDTTSTTAAPTTAAIPVDPSCRNIMAKWCIGLCGFCGYDLRMAASVMSCVDRFVASEPASLADRDNYQLVVMACLYLVTKVQQTRALEPSSVAKLSRGKYSRADIEATELAVLGALGWCVNPPTPVAFAREFVALLMDDAVAINDNDRERILELVDCQIERVVCDYELGCLHRPSHVAFGALSNALESLDMDCSGLGSIQTLKSKLGLNNNDELAGAATTATTNTTIDDVSTALLRIVSSCEESLSNSSSALLIHKVKQNNSTTDSSSSSSNLTNTTKTDSSCVHSSPRGVAGEYDALC